MPEILEVEAYRRVAAECVGRRIGDVDAPDGWYLKGGISPGTLADALVGAIVTGARRRGKLLLVDTDRRTVLGLRFGMTGRLLLHVPGRQDSDPVGSLVYGPDATRARWDRFALRFTDEAVLRLNDPRRLGGVELDPSLERFGAEATTLDDEDLAAALANSTAPVKAVLMDQRRIAGLGNLLADEVLWRAGVSPMRPADHVDADRIARVAAAVRDVVAELGRRGGSHTGDLQPHRQKGGECPRCGTPLVRGEVGGRTTWWCPREQR